MGLFLIVDLFYHIGDFCDGLCNCAVSFGPTIPIGGCAIIFSIFVICMIVYQYIILNHFFNRCISNGFCSAHAT